MNPIGTQDWVTVVKILVAWNVALTFVVGWLMWSLDTLTENLKNFASDVKRNMNALNKRLNEAGASHTHLAKCYNAYIDDMRGFVKRVEEFMED